MRVSRRVLLWLALIPIAIVAALLIQPSAISDQGGPFVPPDMDARARAVGPLSGLNPKLNAAFSPSDKSFRPIPRPGPSDWLANHPETGQSFARFRRGRPNRPDRRRNKIYFQPLGDFDSDDGPSLKRVAAYANAFFSLPTEILPAVEIEGLPVTRRKNRDTEQMLSTDILAWLQNRVPNDAYCLLAVTMRDLYPDPQWNYVFGQASLRDRVGVYSFIRYSPQFWSEQANEKTESLMLRRSCRVLAHETGHMFGVQHCVHYHCVMNGSNHLDESDNQPLHLCPVCLRKLHWSADWDLLERYRELKQFSEKENWTQDVGWLENRIQTIESAK